MVRSEKRHHRGRSKTNKKKQAGPEPLLMHQNKKENGDTEKRKKVRKLASVHH